MLPSIELDWALVNSIEIAIKFVKTKELWVHTHVNLDDVFYSHVSQHLDNDCDLTIVAKAHSQNDWPMYEEVMKSKLKSLRIWKEFSLVEITPKEVNPMACKWMFVKKQDKFENIFQYKIGLVA